MAGEAEPFDAGGSDDGVMARLGVLIDALGGPVKAAKTAEVSRQTIDQWRAGKSKIALAGAARLAEATGRSLDWLVTGREMPGATSVTTFDAEPRDGFVSVPILQIRASAGNGLVALESSGENALSFREDWMHRVGLTPGKVEAMFVTGESMDPTIRDGDMILVERQIDRVVDGAIYVLVMNGEVRLKRVFVRANGAMLIKSDNNLWPEELVSADATRELIIEGRVRWFGRVI